jgi:catechol 2,3-dioxygenase-like lactoylglutathione lyase family enzyme
MIKLDHLTIPVRDRSASRDWYVETLGLKVEFEVPARNATALQDDGGFTIFVEQREASPAAGTALYFSVDDVDAVHAQRSARGVPFVHPPQKVFWGYGAELVDPDGYRVRLWDEKTMRDKA